MKAYELLADPASWTQGAYARDDAGYACSTHDPHACRWCLTGALRKCYRDDERFSARRRLEDAVGVSPFAWFSPFVWNDALGRTHAEVLAVLKKADV